MSATITVHYSFHPYCKEHLEILTKPRNKNGAFIVKDPLGKSLKIPFWMTQPKSADYRISNSAIISTKALLSLADYIKTHFE